MYKKKTSDNKTELLPTDWVDNYLSIPYCPVVLQKNNCFTRVDCMPVINIFKQKMVVMT